MIENEFDRLLDLYNFSVIRYKTLRQGCLSFYCHVVVFPFELTPSCGHSLYVYYR